MPRRCLGDFQIITFILCSTSYFFKRQQPKTRIISDNMKMMAPLGIITETSIPILTPMTRNAHPTPLPFIFKLTTSALFYA